MQQPRDFSLYGAVDLGARQSAAQRRQQAARNASSGGPDAPGGPGGPGGPASEFVIDVTEETFNADVAVRSRTTPVVVELWVAWSEQGKQLGPALEKLADEAGGAWVLARVDADANPRLAQLFQAQSFPMVAAIIGGQVVAVIGGQMGDTFLDAISAAQLQEWLAQVLSVAEQLGLQVAAAAPGEGEDTDEDADPLPPALAAARDAMEDGDLDAAAAALEKAIADGPPDPLAKSWLAQVNLMRRVSAADPAAASRTAAAHPDDVEAQLKVADFAMAGGDAEQAFDRVLGVIKRTSGAERNTARLHLLDLFEVLPPDDDRVKKARTQLTLLLF
jgi:putative thioredoxin